MKKSKFITGFGKTFFYGRMSLGCAWYFLPKWKALGGVAGYILLLRRAAGFTRIFYCHKLLKLPDGRYKLDFYMPAYPGEAFFRAMESKLAVKPPRPVSVVFSISKACRFHCPHCYQQLDKSAELPLPELVATARTLREFGITAYAIEGGEPLLRFERLEAVLQELRGLELWVNSTGDGATPEKIAAMKRLGVTGVMSSIHSVDHEAHDRFTGVPGSWEMALQFLADCKEAGLLIGFNTVLEDDAIIRGGIDEIMTLAAAHECDYIQLIHPKPSGKWLGRQANQSREAVGIAVEAQRRYNSARLRRAPILTAQVFEESPEMLGCTCGGIDRFYIGADGDVQPCEFVNLSFGNLREETFETIYQRMRECFPVPCSEWICSSKAAEIAEAFRLSNTETAPLPWSLTEPLVKEWKHEGTPTEVYRQMRVYKK